MRIDRPIIIVGAPRSGTTLLYSILSSHPALWSLYRESEGILGKYFHPAKFGWQRGDELGAEDARRGVCEAITRDFYRRALNYQALFPNAYSTVYTNPLREKAFRLLGELLSPVIKPPSIRLAEKKPKNCLRVSFLNVVFPDAFFVFLARDPRANISSLMEGWRQPGRYETYHLPSGLQIDGYDGVAWNFLLPPGWQKYARGARLEEVCSFQYRAANQNALEALRDIPNEQQVHLHYEELVGRPQATVSQLCKRVDLSFVGGLKRMTEQMPLVNTASQPAPDKWRQNERKVMSVLETVGEISRQMGYDL